MSIYLEDIVYDFDTYGIIHLVKTQIYIANGGNC